MPCNLSFFIFIKYLFNHNCPYKSVFVVPTIPFLFSKVNRS